MSVDGSVITVGEDDRRSLRSGKPRRRDKISRHRRALERDGLRSNWRIVQRKARVERLRLFVESRDQSGIDRRAIDRMIGGRIKRARFQIEFVRAVPVAVFSRRFRCGDGEVPRLYPNIGVRVRVAGADFPSNFGELAEVRTAIGNVCERPRPEAVEKVVFKQDAHQRFPRVLLFEGF